MSSLIRNATAADRADAARYEAERWRLQQPTEAESEEAAVDGCGRA